MSQIVHGSICLLRIFIVAVYLNFNITGHPVSLLASLVSKSSSWGVLRVRHV